MQDARHSKNSNQGVSLDNPFGTNNPSTSPAPSKRATDSSSSPKISIDLPAIHKLLRRERVKQFIKSLTEDPNVEIEQVITKLEELDIDNLPDRKSFYALQFMKENLRTLVVCVIEMIAQKLQVLNKNEAIIKILKEQNAELLAKVVTLEEVMEILTSCAPATSLEKSFVEKFEKGVVDFSEMSMEDAQGFWDYSQIDRKGTHLPPAIEGNELEYITQANLAEEFGVKDLKFRKQFFSKLDLLKHGQLCLHVKGKFFSQMYHKSICAPCRHDTFETFSKLLKEKEIDALFDLSIIEKEGIFGEEAIYLTKGDLQKELQVPRKNLAKIMSVLKEWRSCHDRALQKEN